MRIRDIVIHIGNDFFQSFMMTSDAFPLFSKTQSGSKLKAFARLFFLAILTLSRSLAVAAVELKAKKSGDFAALTQSLNQEPFWHKKSVWAGMEKDRKIPVSVTHDPSWSFKGAGIVKAPRAFCLEKAKEFNRLSEVPEYMPEVRFDPEKSILHLKVIFLKKEKTLDLELSEEKGAAENRIYFRSVGEWLSGLQGAISFKDHGRQETEVGLIAQYSGEVAWVPNWLITVAAEGVMHHVAEQLRKAVENDYKK